MSFSITNLILNTDSYKPSHWLQQRPGTINQFSYVESRGGKFPVTVFSGLQPLLIDWLSKPITMQDIDEAERFLAAHGTPFNREGWEYIVNTYGGYLPVSIKAVPEGLVVPTGNVLVTIEATDQKSWWLVSYLETMVLRAVWYMTTVATQSWTLKQLIKSYLEETGDVSLLPFKLHDFGARGVSSFESAGIGGAAHLINFMGTDTISGVLYAQRYYNTQSMVGFSIPAAEHSTITSWGRDNEVKAYENMVRQFAKPGSILAVVSDSYDIFNAVSNLWGEELRQLVVDSGATVVIRPDSGDPVDVNRRLIEILGEKFGYTVNAKGYKVLNNVRLIQGDGVCEETIRAILSTFKNMGWSADNIAFGMGGALLQKVDRDTLKFAMKCSAIAVAEGTEAPVWYDVYKDPITDSGKRSKRGRLKLVRMKADNSYHTVREDVVVKGPHEEVLVEVFRNGKILKLYTFGAVRANSEL